MLCESQYGLVSKFGQIAEIINKIMKMKQNCCSVEWNTVENMLLKLHIFLANIFCLKTCFKFSEIETT